LIIDILTTSVVLLYLLHLILREYFLTYNLWIMTLYIQHILYVEFCFELFELDLYVYLSHYKDILKLRDICYMIDIFEYKSGQQGVYCNGSST